MQTLSFQMLNILAAAELSQGKWLLPALVLVPLFGGLLMLATPNASLRVTALAISLVTFVLSLVGAGMFEWNQAGLMQMAGGFNWVPEFGIRVGFAVDSVSLWLILLTTFLMPLTILGTWDDAKNRTTEFYLWLLVLESALIGVFAATDVILFYVFFEMTLVPLFFLIGIFGSANRLYAAYKFFIFTLAGSVFTLAAIIYVAWFAAHESGVWTFYIPTLTEAARQMSLTQQGWVLAGLLAGFAIKVPLFPVHTWLPLAHTEAPTAGSVVLAGVLLKLGSYGLYRFALPMAPAAVVEYAPAIAVLCIIGIIYAALICWVQSDLKRLVAYSSVSHMGFCILGLFALNDAGVGGSVMYMINHGLSTGALFLCVGMIYNRYHTRDMDEMSGLGRRMPVWGFFMVFFALASVGLPGLNGFVGEFLTIFGTFRSDSPLGPWWAAAAATGLILGAIYVLYMIGRVVYGPLREPPEAAAEGHVHDLNWREIGSLAPIAVACLVLGLYPSPMLRSFEPSIAEMARPARHILQTQTAGTSGETLTAEVMP
jgi:NADH-quinone oxidoreductase subunit M